MSTYRLPDYVNPPPCPVNILMLTDKDGCYAPVGGSAGRAQRSLHLLVQSLTRPNSLLNARIRRAHREPFRAGTVNAFAETADEGFQSFRFRYDGAGERSLENFDEVWLFGILNNDETGEGRANLTDEEVAALGRFMS